MNSIFGRINTNKSQINQKLFNQSIDALSVFPKVKTEFCIEKNVGFGQILFPPYTNAGIKKSTYRIVSDSKLYNSHELISLLNLTGDNIEDADVIVKAYEKWGKDCVKYFLGDFAFAIWNSEKEELFCARDHLGIKPFYYFFNDKSFVFCSDISSILAQEDLKFTVDEQYIADSISILNSEKYRTNYIEINKLPPASCMFLKNNKLEINPYWELKTQETIQKNDSEIIEDFKTLLFEAVKCRVENNSISTELSGGIDSSSITAIASQFSEVKTFSHVLPDHLLGKIYPLKDERTYINLLDDYCKIKDRYFISSENNSLLHAIKENVFDYKGITQQNFGIFSDQLYQQASKVNTSILLSGFGGDELVTSRSLGYLSELASNNQWKELKKDLKNQKINSYRYFKTLLKYYLKIKVPFIYNLIAFNKDKSSFWIEKFENLAINKAFSKKLEIKERHLTFYKKSGNVSLQENAIERICHSHVSQRLEYCSLIARKYGIEYRYPLLDIRLIEFYQSMPSRLKAQDGIGRFAIRKAIEGIVPEKIQWRNDKSGATIPSVFMRMIHDKEQILELINRAKNNEAVKKYIDLEEYEHWFYKLCQRSDNKQVNVNPGAFYNYLKLILFIETNPSLFE
jgi:asparagine synthase (glutamine-hydrolysing)